MDNSKKNDIDAEAILMTLDQLNQTLDIMHGVVGRLRTHLTTQLGKTTESANAEPQHPLISRSVH